MSGHCLWLHSQGDVVHVATEIIKLQGTFGKSMNQTLVSWSYNEPVIVYTMELQWILYNYRPLQRWISLFVLTWKLWYWDEKSIFTSAIHDKCSVCCWNLEIEMKNQTGRHSTRVIKVLQLFRKNWFVMSIKTSP